jgi:hypothetical protein
MRSPMTSRSLALVFEPVLAHEDGMGAPAPLPHQRCACLQYDTGIERTSAVSDQLRVLDEVGGVADHTRHQHLARRQFCVLPHPPFVLVPHIGGLEGIVLRLHLEDQVDDVLEPAPYVTLNRYCDRIDSKEDIG